MMKTRVTGLAAALTVLLPVLGANAAIPHANCRPTDVAETGLQGETTADEIDAGLPAHGFTCNADLVGQYQGEGASWQLTAWKNCAYFDQRQTNTEAHPGVAVIDVTDPTAPTPTAWLSTESMIDPWESLKVNPARQLLAGDQHPLNATAPAQGFDVYDISADCKHPVLQASVNIPGSWGHTGQWAPDGKTYYITPIRSSPSIVAVDVTDPTHPGAIPGGIYSFLPSELPSPVIHDLEFSKDGNTAYLAMIGFSSGNGLAIIDVSDFQQRRANPKYRVISNITWTDGSFVSQNALPVTIAGKPYILFTDEAGTPDFLGPSACTTGISGNGFPRLIDISDPANPVVVAKIQMDVADPANCAHVAVAPITSSQTTLADGGVVTTTGPSFFGYSCHYCNVDDVDDAKIAGCNCFAAGLRFFDIHDPTNVKEMAYFKPPAQGTKVLPASQYANISTPSTFVREFDWASSKVSFPKDRGDTSGDVWTTSQDNGFMVISLFSAVSVSPHTDSILVGGTDPLNATVSGAVATAGVTWTLKESSGASVDATGLFTGTTAGTYHVTATSILDTTKSDTATITVTQPMFPAAFSGSGCSAAPASAGGLMLGLVPLAWLLWRRQRRRS